MKKIAMLTVVLLLAAGISAGANTVLFSDNYNVSGNSWDINYEYNAGRQGGVAGPVQYTENPFSTPRVDPLIDDGHKDQLSQVSAEGSVGTLSLFSTGNWGNDFKYAWASPNYNFENWSNLTIEFDVNPTVTGEIPGSGITAGISFGSDVQGAYFWPQRGSYGNPISPSGGQGIAIDETGRVICYGNDWPDIVFGGVTPHSGFYHFKITIDTPSYGAGQPALVTYTVDGIIQHAYTRAGGFNNNFITLGAESINGNIINTAFDNLVISTTSPVPEPGSMLALASGLLGLAGCCIRRRRK